MINLSFVDSRLRKVIDAKLRTTMDLSFVEDRLKNITATDMAALFGLNDRDSPRKIVERKINPQPTEDNKHLRRGRLREVSVLEAFELDLGVPIQRHRGGTITLDGARIAVTPDAFITGTHNVVEAKSINMFSFPKWFEEVPSKYHVQVLAQMLVMNSEYGLIGALEESEYFDFAVWIIERNKEAEDLMLEEVARFWMCMDNGTLFRVNSKIKAKMIALLEKSRTLVCPIERKVPAKDVVYAQEISKMLALLQ